MTPESNPESNPEIEPEVLLEVDGGVAVITLNAPLRRNALTPAMARELIAVCDRVDDDPAVGAAVITGSGGYFCAGGERETLALAGEDPADPGRYDAMGWIYQSFKRVGALRVPTVAAVRGGAVGAGTNLVLASDLRVIGEDAKLVSGFLGLGLHQGGGHGTLLARMGGRETAHAMSLFGCSVDGPAAVRLGLAWECHPDELVLARAIELAGVPGRDPDLARHVCRSTRLQALVDEADWDRGIDLERAAQMWSLKRRFLDTTGG